MYIILQVTFPSILFYERYFCWYTYLMHPFELLISIPYFISPHPYWQRFRLFLIFSLIQIMIHLTSFYALWASFSTYSFQGCPHFTRFCQKVAVANPREHCAALEVNFLTSPWLSLHINIRETTAFISHCFCD